jgi:hypothetical protein
MLCTLRGVGRKRWAERPHLDTGLDIETQERAGLAHTSDLWGRLLCPQPPSWSSRFGFL